MLKVGDFSQMAHVTVKTLRHYDRLGLLKPVWVDRYTGYRYYNLDQLPRLHRILAMKDLGFTLAQINRMLDEDMPSSELRRMFDLKQAELAKRLASEQERLQRVAHRLAQIDQHGKLPALEVTIKLVPELTVVSKRSVVSCVSGFDEELSQTRAELRIWSSTAGLRSRDQWILIYHNPEFSECQLDLEVALLVDNPLQIEQKHHYSRMKSKPGSPGKMASQNQRNVVYRRLPAVDEMACLLCRMDTHHRQPGLAAENLELLYAWVESSHYTVTGAIRELQLVDPASGSHQSQYIETQLPVESLYARKTRLLNRLQRKEEDMQPKFVVLPEFTVVGVRYFGKNENQEISELWGEFNRRSNEILHVSEDSPAYGVCLTAPGASNGEFEYVASFRVENDQEVPQDMVVRKIPAHKYAVFTHVGSLDKLSATYQYIYQVWMPQSGYQPGNLDFELYDLDFRDFAPDSKFYIYVPIE